MVITVSRKFIARWPGHEQGLLLHLHSAALAFSACNIAILRLEPPSALACVFATLFCALSSDRDAGERTLQFIMHGLPSRGGRRRL